MIAKLRTVVFGIALFAMLPCIAQTPGDSTTLLAEVVIERHRIEALAMGHFVVKVDSNFLYQTATGSLADLFRKSGYGHLRSYGPGGLATLSLRGTGAGHSSVLWNGLPLQSPLNGQFDLSLVPVFFLDDAELQMGGSGSINGNGAIGGTLHLNGRARFNQGWDVNSMIGGGSFSTWFGGIGQKWSGEKFSTDTRLFLNKSKNDFAFRNNNLSPARREHREHAAYNQAGVLHQSFWQPLNNWLLQVRMWFQDNFTELPNPSFVFRTSESDQRDKFVRSMIGAQFTPGKASINFLSSFVHHRIAFRQDNSTPLSLSNFTTFSNSIEATFFSSEAFELTSGVNHTFEQGQADELLPASIRRSRSAVYGALKYTNEGRWKSSLSARQEVLNDVAMPFAPALGAEVRVARGLTLKGSISRNYRVPTLNDLYWLGVGAEGNGALRAEHSWSEEFGLDFQSATISTKHFSARLAIFSNQVDNWILWRPVGQLWTPGNVKKVWSRGTEMQSAFNFLADQVKITVGLLYTYTLATTIDVHDESAESEIGSQLIYTPANEGSINASARWRNWSISGILGLTGRQFTDTDNNPLLALKAYPTSSLWLQRDITGSRFRGSAILEANNLTGTSYETRQGYPMPGRNFKLTLNFSIQQ